MLLSTTRLQDLLCKPQHDVEVSPWWLYASPTAGASTFSNTHFPFLFPLQRSRLTCLHGRRSSKDTLVLSTLLLSTLDSVELANLAELDWEAALLPLERDERRGGGDIDIDSDIGLLDEDDVSAILSDLDTVQQLSSCELDALLGAGSDSNSDSDSDSDIAYTVDVESLLFT
ncbi:unnamed protein product [Phytophthora lilii]|uniref:Unnamed protein product n=1 Tax=Phytophthora lilii TaxID=2077276 RepID=A0A9W7CMU0_9STRA|nr:unnamed protein product [Phytophthora lilii]